MYKSEKPAEGFYSSMLFKMEVFFFWLEVDIIILSRKKV